MKCKYGCNKEAKFQLKNGNWCCSKFANSCSENKRKNSNGVKQAHLKGKYPENTFGDSVGWSKGLSKETDNRVKHVSSSLKLRYETHKSPFFGKHHSTQTRELLSQKSQGGRNGFIKTKHFSIFNPFMKKICYVQGTWELKYAEYLNKNNIKWINGQKMNLKYKNHEKDINHTYYPDFYLFDSDEYIEIKGWWFASKDGKIDDRRKMEKVIEQNKNKKIKILEGRDLKALGIIL